MTNPSRRSPSSASKKCITLYTSSSRRGRQPSRLVVFRLPVGVYRLLRENVGNLSEFLRCCVYEKLQSLPFWFECEEFRLRMEIAELERLMEDLKRRGTMLLKHGSYCEDYVRKVKGQLIVFDRKPYFTIGEKPRPPAKPEEIATIEELAELRENLSKIYNRKVKRLIQLEKARISRLYHNKKEEGGEKNGENGKNS